MNINPNNIPYNLEAEQNLLASLIVRPDGLEDCCDILKSDHFYNDLHKDLFLRLYKAYETGENITVAVLKENYKNDTRANKNTPQYIDDLANSCLTTRNNKEYALHLAALAQRRLLQDIIDRASACISDNLFDTPNDHIITEIENAIINFSDAGEAEHTYTNQQALEKAVLWMQKVRSGEIVPISTGYKQLDKAMGGFYAGGLYFIGARPSMGKTALALNMAEATAKTGETLFFSLEMGADEMAMRQVARRTGIGVTDQRQAMKLTDDQLRSISRTELSDKLHIVDKAGLTMGEIALRCRRHKRKHGLNAVFIDYLGLITSNNSLNKVQQIGEITQQAKILARDLNVPVIMLSQLSRAIEGRDNKRPMLSDLRDSGSIEQDGDVVMFVYREEYYLERETSSEVDFYNDKAAKENANKIHRLEQVRGKAEVILGKNRQGNLTTAHLNFDGLKQEFSEPY